MGADLLGVNKLGDTVLHLAIRHGKLDYVRKVLEFIQQDNKYKSKSLDIENMIEYCTPYMLALIKEHFEIGEELLQTGKVDKYYRNVNKEHVFRMAKRLKLTRVMKYIYHQEGGQCQA